MKVDVCAICGAESAVADPESEPPYAHLSCVLKAGDRPGDYPKALRFYHADKNAFNHKDQGYGARAPDRHHLVVELRQSKTRQRLHPAVFETQEPPLRSQSTTPQGGSIDGALSTPKFNQRAT